MAQVTDDEKETSCYQNCEQETSSHHEPCDCRASESEYEYEEGEEEQRLLEDAPEPTYNPAPLEATTLDLFGDPAPPPLQVSE